MRTVQIHTGRPYAIHIGHGVMTSICQELQALYPKRKPKIAIVTDDLVDSLWGEQLCQLLSGGGYNWAKFAFPNGEASKNLEAVRDVYSFLAQNSITRSDVIIALGGGVVGDLAGFAAASWLRGIDFIQVPTTFLAMIDSSVGGKTGVDIPQGKNLVGAFWQPSLVLCDLDAMDTLPQEVFSDGTAEAIKYGAILDSSLFSLLENGQLQEHLEQVVARCIELKKQVVEQDERDNGQRQLLNFGHTLGHAIERCSGFTLTHGKAVAIGMVKMTRASQQVGITAAGTAHRIEACCRQYGLPVENQTPLELLCQSCMGDKKRKGSTLTLILLKEIGRSLLYPIEVADLESFLRGETHV